MFKKYEGFFKKHSTYNATVHVLIGMGLGVLITYPFAGTHPVRVGVAFLIVGLIGHLYPILGKK